MKTNHTHVIGLSNLWCVERRKVNYNYFMVYKFAVSVFESENDWNLLSDFQEQLETEINNQKQYFQKQ